MTMNLTPGLSDIAFLRISGVIKLDPYSVSINTGSACIYLIISADAVKVIEGTKTLSPGLIPRASIPRCKAAVQEFTAQAYLAPTRSANSLSNSSVFPEVVNQP